MTDPDRWTVAFVVAVGLAAVGVLARNTPILLSAAVPLSFVVYASATRDPSLSVDLERHVDDRTPRPGQDVAVTLTVENWSDRHLPDVTVLDDPPSGLRVVEGTTRRCTSLEPGASTTLEYTLRAREGVYEFGDPVVVSRDVSGTTERRERRPVATRIACETRVEDVPLGGETVQYAGRVPADEGGEGTEFHSIREYHRSDPIGRVDWNRYARSGDLTTVEFREERAATVVVVLDVRSVSRRRRVAGEADAVAFGRVAAEAVAETLLDRNNFVGVVTFGDDGDYLQPGSGREQRERIGRVLAGEVAAGEHARVVRPFSRRYSRENTVRADRLADRLPTDAQVVFVSPLEDDDAVGIVRRLEAHGHPVTVVATDVTSEATSGGTVVGIERRHRLVDLREHGHRVVEWSPTEPLSVALDRARERWST